MESAESVLGPADGDALGTGVDQERSPGASPLRPVVNTESAMAALDEAIEVHIAQQASRERDPRPSGPVEGIDPLPQLPFGLRTAAEPSAPTTDGQLGVAATLELLRDTPIAPPGGQTSSTNSATDTASQSQPAASPLSSPTASTVNPSPPPSSQGLQASPSMSSPPAQPQPLAGGGMSLAPPAGGGATDGGGGNGNGNGGLQALGPAAAAMPLIPPGGLVIGPDFEARSMAYERDLLRNQLKASAAEKEQLRKQMRTLEQELASTSTALQASVLQHQALHQHLQQRLPPHTYESIVVPGPLGTTPTPTPNLSMQPQPSAQLRPHRSMSIRIPGTVASPSQSPTNPPNVTSVYLAPATVSLARRGSSPGAPQPSQPSTGPASPNGDGTTTAVNLTANSVPNADAATTTGIAPGPSLATSPSTARGAETGGLPPLPPSLLTLRMSSRSNDEPEVSPATGPPPPSGPPPPPSATATPPADVPAVGSTTVAGSAACSTADPFCLMSMSVFETAMATAAGAAGSPGQGPAGAAAGVPPSPALNPMSSGGVPSSLINRDLAGFTSSGAVRITTSGAVLQPASSMPLRSASAPRSDTPAPSDTFPGECLPLNLGLPAIGMGSNGGGGGGGLQPSASASGLHAYVHPTLSPFGSPRRRSRVPSYMPSGANTPRHGAGSVMNSVSHSPIRRSVTGHTASTTSAGGGGSALLPSLGSASAAAQAFFTAYHQNYNHSTWGAAAVAPGDGGNGGGARLVAGASGDATAGSTAYVSYTPSQPTSPRRHDLLAAIQKLEAITTNLRPGIDAELEGLGLGLGGGGGAPGPAAAGVGAGPGLGLGLGGLELHVCEAQLIDSLRDEVDRLRAQIENMDQDRARMQKHIDELEEQLRHYQQQQQQQQDGNAASDEEGEREAVVGDAAAGMQAGEAQASVPDDQEGAAVHEQDGLGCKPGDFGAAVGVTAFGAEPGTKPELPSAGASGDVILSTLQDLPVVAAAEEQGQVQAHIELQQQPRQEEHLDGDREDEGLLPPLPVAEPVTPGEEGAGPDAAAAVAAVAAAVGGFDFGMAVPQPQHTSRRGQEAAEPAAGQEAAQGVVVLTLPALQLELVDQERQQCRALLEDILGSPTGSQQLLPSTTSRPRGGSSSGGSSPRPPAAFASPAPARGRSASSPGSRPQSTSPPRIVTSSITAPGPAPDFASPPPVSAQLPATPPDSLFATPASAATPNAATPGGSGGGGGADTSASGTPPSTTTPGRRKATSVSFTPSTADTSPSASTRSRRTARVLVPYLDRIAASAATAASASQLSGQQGPAAAAAAASPVVPEQSPEEAYSAGYSAGVAAGATAAAAIDLPRVASLANMLIDAADEGPGEGGGEEGGEGAAEGQSTLTAEEEEAEVQEAVAAVAAAAERGGMATSARPEALAAVTLAAAAGVVRASAGSVLPTGAAAAVADNLAHAAVEVVKSGGGGGAGGLGRSGSLGRSTSLQRALGPNYLPTPGTAAAPAAAGAPAQEQAGQQAALGKGGQGAAPQRPGGLMLFGAFTAPQNQGQQQQTRAREYGNLLQDAAAACRTLPGALDMHNLAIAELVAQLTDAEAALSSARSALEERDRQLAAARAALRTARVEAAQHSAAMQASLANALGQVNTLTEQVSGHVHREREAVRAKEQLEARLGLRQGAAGEGPSGGDEASDVRLVLPAPSVDAIALLQEQLAARDQQAAALAARLAEAAEREAAAAAAAADLALKEAQVESLTRALGRALILLQQDRSAAAPPHTATALTPGAIAPGTAQHPLLLPDTATASNLTSTATTAAGRPPRTRRASTGSPPSAPSPPALITPGAASDRPTDYLAALASGSSTGLLGPGALRPPCPPAGPYVPPYASPAAYRTASSALLPATPPASPSSSPSIILSRATSASVAPQQHHYKLRYPQPPTQHAAGAASATSASSDSAQAPAAALAGDHATGSEMAQQGTAGVSAAAAAATASLGVDKGVEEIGTGLEVLQEDGAQDDEEEARRAAAAAVSSGLLRPEEAEALRLRLLLEASGRRLWALRRRLASYEAEREAHSTAELASLAGVLEHQGRLVGRLRVELRSLELGRRGQALAAALGRAGDLLGDWAGGGEGVKEGEGEERGDGVEVVGGQVGEGEGLGEGQGVVATSRRLVADAAAQVAGMHAQLQREAELRAAAEAELAELRQLFDRFVQSTVAQV